MEPEQRGRASRASSTSSLGREVRCGCQYYQSDSLLPERRALLVRPSSRTMQQPPAVRCSEHEYEPIGPPSPYPMAPVVRITDTDVVPVADSNDSIDVLGRLPHELILDGNVILPLDGRIEDSAMEGRELGETGDTSAEELEPTAQQLQDRLEERFLDVPSTPYTESRTEDGEINTSQVDSSTMEELPLRRGARSLPQRLKNQAGKLRSRLRGIQRPKFSFPQKRQKPDKTTTTTTTKRSPAASSGKSDKSRTPEKRPSRIERIRTSISEKAGKFSLPDKSKFHLPERPRFNFPDKSKFNIKKPNIRLPSALTRAKRPPSLREQQQQQQQHSTESTAGGSRRNIFDFATYPRIFDKRSKKRGDYATSSPKDSRAESAESATFPRARRGRAFGARWTSRFGDSASVVGDQDRPDGAAAASDGSPPWHQSSTEEPPRLSARTEEEILAAARAIPWEDARKRYDDEEIQYMDYEQESSEMSDRRPAPPRRAHKTSRRGREESYEREEAIDPRLYEEEAKDRVCRENEDAAARDEWRAEETPDEKFRLAIPRSRSLDEDTPRAPEQEEYDGAFVAVDPRQFGLRKMTSEEEERERELEEEEEEEEEREPSSMQSDREQQASSASSCDRRRRGVIEEIDSDEFFLRASGISQDDVNYLTDEIRDALRSEIVSALQDDELPPTPPQRPMRTRSLRKRKEDSAEIPDGTAPPVRPKRERSARRSREASIVRDEVFRERTRSDSRSDSRHRVVYQTEGDQRELLSQEPLDDIVVVKPARRKSRSSLRSQSQPPMETSILSPSSPVASIPDSPGLPSTPPVVPVRRKRSHREAAVGRRNGDVVVAPICNGHHEWQAEIDSEKPMIPTRSRQSLLDRQADGDVFASASRENIENLEARLQRQDSAPVPPKRRSRSRTTSVAADEDRTSHGAESLPEAGYIEEDSLPREDESGSARDLSGYAIVEKREKPPRPLPPRRKRGKFATTPRPIPPKRPQRAYSTLGPVRTRDTSMTSPEPITRTTLSLAESEPYIEIDADDTEHRDLRSGEVLTKMQGRPLPAPPRPPRSRKEHVERPRTPFEYTHEFETLEATAATQTDPLPDDMVIEEEITQAKLTVTPSRSGSQVLVSTERIPSPSRTGTPPVPPLPISQFLRKEEEEEEEEEIEREMEDTGMAFETVSLTSPSPMREADLEGKHRSAPHLQERVADESPPRPQAVKSGLLLPDEPLRISTLEVGDLKVDRLSVSLIEAHKIVASEIDAMIVTASELRGGDSLEESLSPAIIRELIAIRSHLETVAQERQRESEKESASRKATDIPEATDDSRIREIVERQESSSREAAGSSETELGETVVELGETVASEPAEDEPTKANEDEKVVKTDVIDLREQETSHIPSLAQTKDFPPPQILKVDKLESKDADESIAHLHAVAPDIQDESLRILDPEHPLTLTSRTTSDESRSSCPSPDVPSARSTESRVSPERAEVEPPSGSVQTATTTTATELGATTPSSTGRLRGSKDDVSDSKELPTSRKSRSRSPSPSRGMRQTASPVRSLPPAISVTPDTPDSTVSGHGGILADAQPQRAVISYSSQAGRGGIPMVAQPQRAVISHFPDSGQALREIPQRESSQSPIPSSLPPNSTHFIAFPLSEIPAHFFSLSDASTSQRTDSEPGVIDTTQQLLRALRLAGIKAMRHFVGYLTSTLSADDTREKVREVEIVICALLLLIAGLLIYYFSSTRTVTHYHHWDYFNPPQ